MSIAVGATPIIAVKVGDAPIAKVYSGSDLIADFSEAAPEEAGDILSATFWLRAEDAALTLDGSDGVSAAVNMGAAGSAMDMAQATDAARPTHVASVVNGRAVLRFDGADDQLVTPSVAGDAFLSTDDENVAFLVMQAAADDEQLSPFFWGATRQAEFGTHATWEDGAVYFDSADNDSGAGGGRLSVAAPAGWLTGFHILELVRNGSAAEILVDGVSLQTKAGISATVSTLPDELHLGSRGGSFFYRGDLAEIIIGRGATAVSSATRTQAREVLASYYGITLP